MRDFKYEDLIVKVIELKGNYKEIGFTQGKTIDPAIHRACENLMMFRETAFSDTEAREVVQALLPQLGEEIDGLAAGLGIPLERALELYSGYDFPFPEMGCTTMIQGDYYVRNYDFGPSFYDARFVFNKPNNGYASVGFSGQIIGRLDGMNEKGLTVGLHFVNNKKGEKGFVATTIGRSILDHCSNTDEAINLIEKLPHGYAFNYSITDKYGNSALVEASPHKQHIEKVNPVMCTNHFLHQDMRSENREYIQSSLERRSFLQELSTWREELSPLQLFRQFNDEKSPLFYKQYQQFFGTLHTVVYSPKTLDVMVGVGGNSEPIALSLKDWLDSSAQLPDIIKGRIQLGV
ncbi:C45 family autoproteolytic acyltransferase/hydolase [Bacillus horti]|uniref:Choloylglycine hydrolase n=1 Tax=Caldalkalibacillus horti TaxID=77523 RepID=A0ABT9VVE4_9BACI|nr:C45 family peptidase [Bacillus horti]MDQ0164961.1 putative choloylglycine hydrolase [Bacillus horti]